MPHVVTSASFSFLLPTYVFIHFVLMSYKKGEVARHAFFSFSLSLSKETKLCRGQEQKCLFQKIQLTEDRCNIIEGLN